MFKYQQSGPRNNIVDLIINIITVCFIVIAPGGTVSADSLRDYCAVKSSFAGVIFDERDKVSKNEAISEIYTTWDSTGRLFPRHYIVDMNRIINDVYRKNSRDGGYRLTDHDAFVYRVAKTCLYNGY